MHVHTTSTENAMRNFFITASGTVKQNIRNIVRFKVVTTVRFHVNLMFYTRIHQNKAAAIRFLGRLD